MKLQTLLYPLKAFGQIFRLPKITHQQILQTKDIDNLRLKLKGQADHLKVIEKTIHSIDNKLSRLDDNLLKLKERDYKSHKEIVNTIENKPLLDAIYKKFEDRFRGSEKSIEDRLAFYTDLFKNMPSHLKKKSILDIGCGRGEFLAFAKKNNLKAIGIDVNQEMVRRSRKKGLTVYKDDALHYVSKQKTNSLSAITGFHIIEHLPFEELVSLIIECYRVISEGGILLLETPNPGNLVVGAKSFYLDPSHNKPIPAELLTFILDELGFQTSVIYRHPVNDIIEHKDKDVEKLMKLAYGPRDYVVVAKK